MVEWSDIYASFFINDKINNMHQYLIYLFDISLFSRTIKYNWCFLFILPSLWFMYRNFIRVSSLFLLSSIQQKQYKRNLYYRRKKFLKRYMHNLWVKKSELEQYTVTWAKWHDFNVVIYTHKNDSTAQSANVIQKIALLP